MTRLESLAFSMSSKMFTTPDDINTAFKNAQSLIEAIPAEGGARIGAYTALYSVCNAIAKEINKYELREV